MEGIKQSYHCSLEVVEGLAESRDGFAGGYDELLGGVVVPDAGVGAVGTRGVLLLLGYRVQGRGDST